MKFTPKIKLQGRNKSVNNSVGREGNDSNLLIVFYVQISTVRNERYFPDPSLRLLRQT